ncbi:MULTISPECIES: sporulation YhaL family protein [Clostridia]|uniref:sporulation YhaL family protein n=1 Tax=Clostridia TaxID=186801 RepID=UPI0016017EBE|nr:MULTISPECIES: sporulation YhaL family protein [Clostridia]
MILGVPWWVFVMILLIFVSGYMAFRGMVAERKMEHHFIEQEGEVYMERLRKERELKGRGNQTNEIT